MKRLQIKLLSLCLVVSGMFSTIYAGTIEDFETKASAKVKSLVKKNNLKVVGYDYVLKAIKDGTRKNATATILDARPLKKYQMGHIPSALALPDSKYKTLYLALKLDKNKETIIYCGGYKCAKSAKVAALLLKDGFTDVKVYAAGMPQWQKNRYVEIDTGVAKALYDKKSALFIDARPFGKFAGSTIIGALSVPDKKFDTYSHFMPRYKKAKIVVFCGGYACHKSHKVATKLVKMGYKNVKVYAAGFPEWKKENHPITGSKKQIIKEKKTVEISTNKFIKAGEDTGTVDGEWFIKNYKNFPKDVTLVNVLDPKEYAAGHLANAINVHAEDMTPKQLLASIPKTGDVIFICGTGTRAMEARGFLEEDLKYKQMDRIWYLDANIVCNKENICTIEPNEPLGI